MSRKQGLSTHTLRATVHMTIQRYKYGHERKAARSRMPSMPRTTAVELRCLLDEMSSFLAKECLLAAVPPVAPTPPRSVCVVARARAHARAGHRQACMIDCTPYMPDKSPLFLCSQRPCTLCNAVACGSDEKGALRL